MDADDMRMACLEPCGNAGCAWQSDGRCMDAVPCEFAGCADRADDDDDREE